MKITNYVRVQFMNNKIVIIEWYTVSQYNSITVYTIKQIAETLCRGNDKTHWCSTIDFQLQI